MIPESAQEADKLESAQLEFGIANMLCDEWFKEMHPNTFNNEPCLSCFGVNDSDTWIYAPCETNDSIKGKCEWLQVSYHILEPQKCTYSAGAWKFDLRQLNGYKFNGVFIQFGNFQDTN